MLSFKNFMLKQEEDLSPEMFQKKYEEYQVKYANDAVTFFFDTRKNEEWFHERYNPHKQRELFQEATEWAKSESAYLKNIVNDKTKAEEIVEAMSLEPSSSSTPTNCESKYILKSRWI